MNKELFDKGLKIRREVLGAESVDAVLKSADDFFMPFQELTTQYCWGEIWGRPGLDRKTRSLINLAMISSLNRSNELKLHIKGAMNNGVTKEEMVEVFLQVAVYAGIPAGLESFRIAMEVFAQDKS
jgi:4-carboxymuconolactone decarboxylase